jgi:hypothetical protein
MRRHWGAVVVLGVAVALALVGAVYVFLWFANNAESTGFVPRILGLWTIANLVTFILYVVFWELLLVGIPVIMGAVVLWQWWKRLPEEERRQYHLFKRRSRTTRGSGGVSLLFFIAFAIKVLLDGKWNTPIATFTLDYVVGSIVTILEWGLVIIGIPATIALTWWVRRETRRQ